MTSFPEWLLEKDDLVESFPVKQKSVESQYSQGKYKRVKGTDDDPTISKNKIHNESGIFIFDSRSELKLNPLIGRINKNKQGKQKVMGLTFFS